MLGKAGWRRWRLLTGLASSILLVVGLSLTATPAAAQGGAAIHADLAYNVVDTDGWAPEAWVNFVIQESADPGARVLFDESVQTDAEGRAGVDLTSRGEDLAPGMVVTVAGDDGGPDPVTKELVLATVTLDLIDVVEEELFGTAPDGTVDLWIQGDDEGHSYQVAATGGQWTFPSPVDITPETIIGINVSDDDGDTTKTSGRLPTVNAEAQHENIWTNDWMPGTAVTLTVFEAPGAAVVFEETRTVSHESDNRGWDTQVGFDLTPGMLVTASGGLMTKELVVLDVAVDIDPATDTISGTTEPDARVSSWRPEEFSTVAGLDGIWSYTFAGDLKPSTHVELAIADSDGDTTGFDAQLWPASVGAELLGSQVEGQDFTPSAAVVVEVYGVSGKRLFIQRVIADEDGGFYTDSGLIHTAGMQVTARELANDWSKELTLAPVTFDVFDASTGHLAGTAPPDAGLVVGVTNNTDEESPNAWAQADENGDWTAELESLGYDPADYQSMYGFAEFLDEDGDRAVARYRFHWVSGNLTSNTIEGAQFTGLGTVTVEISRSVNGPRLYLGAVKTDTSGGFTLAPKKVDLTPGMHIVVTDGSATRDLVLAPLTITGFDPMPLTPFAEGTAEPGTRVWVDWSFHDKGGGASGRMLTTADPGDGHWFADFGAADSWPGPGSAAGASTRDGDGDWTYVDYVPPKKTQ